ncbi:hypothetical protein [Salipiger thiooxidans]|uniref:hypothetical protein n=1 Tax=Salipiger thiooxidans TaxID=282683 RepID=UPI001CFB7561|nr:hypothetical protein [Salipiger thiooxidans]
MRSAVTTIFALSIGLIASGSSNAQPSFLTEKDPGDVIAEACFEIDVEDPIAVYDCLATADNIERFRSTDECRKIYGAYRGMVREAYKQRGISNPPRGYIKGPETADAPLPSCEVAAEVLFELSGEEPYWTPCLGYDPAQKVEHFKNCVIAYFQGRERRDEASAIQRFQSAGCDELKRFYYQFAMPAAYKERIWPDGQIIRLPANIEDIDCLEIAAIEF